MRIEAIKTIALAISIFIIFMLSTCEKSCPKVKISEGTTYRHKKDTHYIFMAVPLRMEVAVKTPIYIHDTIYQGQEESVYKYNNPYEDSLLKGEISSLTLGKLIKQEFSYILKKPLQTIIRDTFEITKTVVIDSTQKPKTQLGIGVQVAYPNPMISLHIFVKSKNNSIFGLGYDPFYKSILLQYNKVLTFKRK